jgi:tetratricopeptide (TPR) repeat protein
MARAARTQSAEPKIRTASLAARALLAFAVALSASSCAKKLLIRSEPSGADVVLNDSPAGKTPLEVDLGALARTPNIKIQLNKPDYGTFSGYIPGPTSASLSSEIEIVLPKTGDESDKLNKQMSLVKRAERLAVQKKPEEAVKLLDESIKEFPRFAALHLAKANVLFLVKNYDGALAQYKKVLQIEPTNDEAITMVAFFKKRSLAGNQSGAQPRAAVPAPRPEARPGQLTPATQATDAAAAQDDAAAQEGATQ